ncbi:MAG TPA: PadR family transcriptional regulator [bacterium]|nr:PadR family transcriptional regulator [bacterium]
MDRTARGSMTRHFGDLRPEFVPLGFLVEEPTHGYELYRRFSETLAGLWRLSESQMYATLKRLEYHGLIESSAPEKGSAASRRVLSPTAGGRRLFDAWLAEPTVCSPRVLRLEFLSRLFFARRMAPDSIAGMFADQRVLVSDALGRLGESRGHDTAGFDVFDLALAFSESQLRSALAWLDADVAPALERDRH